MTPKVGASIGDLVAMAVALWFIFGASFADYDSKQALDAVALVVFLYSGWRIWRRHAK